MEGQIISKEPELDETEIKGLIEDFETIGILLEGHLTVFSSPVLTPKSKKMCDEGLVLIKDFTQKCFKHYGLSHFSK
jgi:hypothetical protein